MLETIKSSINCLPDESFGEFYQQYISDLEDAIIEYDISKVSLANKSIEDIPEFISSINKLSEGLKC